MSNSTKITVGVQYMSGCQVSKPGCGVCCFECRGCGRFRLHAVFGESQVRILNKRQEDTLLSFRREWNERNSVCVCLGVRAYLPPDLEFSKLSV